MTPTELAARLRSDLSLHMPLPGSGQTAMRHRLLMQFGRENLSFARLAEAHWDAIAILSEAGRQTGPSAIYGVWASEVPSDVLDFQARSGGMKLSGVKNFCSGAGIIDRALIAIGSPHNLLVDLDLRSHSSQIHFDTSVWKAQAFRDTQTAKVTFNDVPILAEQIIGDHGFYLDRSGFWHGACGPAACWAGGAEALVEYALGQTRSDPHTLAHLGAMTADVWALKAYLTRAGTEIDASAQSGSQARSLALTVRHLVEQACMDILTRLARAYGPRPLSMDEDISLRYQELELYIRQCHGERDLESLARETRNIRTIE
jgi:alkylation response protein AidB-like acyl-CoA dehydrogenase